MLSDSEKKARHLAASRRSMAKVRDRDPEAWRQKGIAYRAANPEKVRKWSLRYYGITPAAFDAMHERQGGRCPICADPIPLIGKGRHLDHNHTTGEIRGILCQRCNHGLGNFRDNPQALQQAARFLLEAGTGIIVANLERLNRGCRSGKGHAT